MAAAVAVIVIIAVAAGVGIVLSSKGSTTTSTSSTSTSSATFSYTSSSTTSSTTSSSQTSNSTTTSSSIVPVGCVFAPPGPKIVNTSATVPTTSLSFTGCLTPGATGVYLIGIIDPNGVVGQGVVRAQYASQITIAGAVVGNLTAAGNGTSGTFVNDTTVLSVPNLVFFGDRGYGVTIVNQSGQNDTVTIILNLEDQQIFEA